MNPMSVAPPPVTYRIDAEGKIVYVNAQWDIFAQQNDGEAALSARVLGRPLASFQSDSTVRMDKVTEIQAALASGSYNVPASAVASKVVDSMLSEQS